MERRVVNWKEESSTKLTKLTTQSGNDVLMQPATESEEGLCREQ